MNSIPSKTVCIITLGCSKNTVDSEYLARQLEANGFIVTFDSENIQSNIVIINTCGFIDDAKKESIDTILEMVRYKKERYLSTLIVMGCLSKRYRNELQTEIPEVDHFFGVFEMPEILKTLKTKYNSTLENNRYLSTPSHYAYLKISDGCNRTCSFCAIPLIKGNHISKPVKDIVEETRDLTRQGTKEIILIAQDLNYYGMDLNKQLLLPELITQLSEIEKIEWIRLHYLYPLHFPFELLSIIRENEKVCKYIDIPFQHSNDTILKNMRRGMNKKQMYTLIEKIKKEVPGIAIRTTLMVGFPGEGKKEFEELKDFIKEVQFDRLGVFTYSEEEGTTAAQHYTDNVKPDVKQERRNELMALQQEISFKHNKDKIGKTFKTIIDRKEGKYYIGRTQFDSPEIDNEVLIKENHSNPIDIGKFYTIEIIDANEYDLFGEYRKS